jgi:putative nucleotidyltransferase with HDIG domain
LPCEYEQSAVTIIKPAAPTDRPSHSPDKERLCVIAETQAEATKISRSLSDLFCLYSIDLDHLLDNEPAPLEHSQAKWIPVRRPKMRPHKEKRAKPDSIKTGFALAFVDIDLGRSRDLFQLRSWLQQRPDSEAAVFAVDRESRIQLVRAFSLGASDVIFRPYSSRALRSKLLASREPSEVDAPTIAIEAGLAALQNVFLSASTGEPLDTRLLAKAGDALVDQIETHGLADWVQAVRVHHNLTYQHCLLVAGSAAAFAVELGFCKSDRQRVAISGLLHDIGKARIPVAILDKPSKLDPEELAVVRQHSQLGFEALRGTDGLHAEMLEMVRDHHELLDGSGYPQGVSGSEISDLTRVITITDIFGALIEFRPYKPPMEAQAAYQILEDMGAKLDRDLVRAFKPLSRVTFS